LLSNEQARNCADLINVVHQQMSQAKEELGRIMNQDFMQNPKDEEELCVKQVIEDFYQNTLASEYLVEFSNKYLSKHQSANNIISLNSFKVVNNN